MKVRRILWIVVLVGAAFGALCLYPLRLSIAASLIVPNGKGLVESALRLAALEQSTDSAYERPRLIPQERWPDAIRQLNPGAVYLIPEGLLIRTFGSGLTRDGGYTVTLNGRPPRDEMLHIFPTWYPHLYYWHTVANE